MQNLINNLRNSLPARAVVTQADGLAAFETDWRRIHSHPALCAVLPETAAQIATVLQLCAQAGVAVVPQGGNTGMVAGAVPVAGAAQIILNLRRMDKILQIDLEGDTLTVQAGASLQAVQDAAAAAGRLFPVSLGAEGTAQIGGVISTNAGGIQVLSYGSMRAQVLGLEVVLVDGRIWNGLRALRKDNTGFDLKQIFIGAEGTLGIITTATLRLHPAVTARATALIGIASLDAALAVFRALRAAAGTGLTMCEFISRPAMDLAVGHIPGGRLPCDAPAYVLLEISSHSRAQTLDAALLAALEPLLEANIALDAVIAQSGRERADLLRIRDAIPEGELAEGGAVKHDIAVPIGRVPETIRQIETLMATEFPDLRLNIFGHIGDGNLHVNIRPPAGRTLRDIDARKAEITEKVENLAMAQGGSFSAEHGIGQMRITGMKAHKSTVELDMMRALKRAFDPAGLLNPGKLLPPEA